MLLAVARPPDEIHLKVIERGIHIHPYGIERLTKTLIKVIKIKPDMKKAPNFHHINLQYDLFL